MTSHDRPSEDLGGVGSLDRYCRHKGFVESRLDGPSALDWRCVTKQGDVVAFDMTDACRWHEGRPDVVSMFRDRKDPSSWRCYTVT
jgi:hypothetical protein